MFLYLEESGVFEELKYKLEELRKDKEIKTVILLSAEKNDVDTQKLSNYLKKYDKNILGGIFPGIIYKNKKYDRGNLIVGLKKEGLVKIVPQLSLPDIDYQAIMDSMFDSIDKFNSLFVFVDGLAKRINALMESLFNFFGFDVNYMGGGAGSLSLKQKPCIFSNRGVIMDAAVIGAFELTSEIGVNHGWRKIDGPFKVTESDRNKIDSIDWEPAYKIYKKIVDAHSDTEITKSNFFEVAKNYPFGISKLGTEYIVRDPIDVSDNSVICVGEVPTESYINILHGTSDSLIKAADKALKSALHKFPNLIEDKSIFFIDCISRVLFLEDEFDRELEVIAKANLPVWGILSLGEIANSGDEFLEFYNKTAVVAVLEN